VYSPHDARKAMKRQGVQRLGASHNYECANVPVLMVLGNQSGGNSCELTTHRTQLNSPLKHQTMTRRVSRRTYSFDSGVRLDGACLPLTFPTMPSTTLDRLSRHSGKRTARATTGIPSPSQCFDFISSLIKELRKRVLQCSFLKAVAMVASAAIVSFLVSWSYLRDEMFVPLWAPVDITKMHTANATLAMYRHKRTLESIALLKGYSLVFPTQRRVHKSKDKSTMFRFPTSSLDEENHLKAIRRDFGRLEIHIPEDESMRLQRRTIYHDFDEDERYEDLQPEDDDSIDNYYAFDDDYNRNPLMAYEDTEIHKTKQCRRTKWHRDLPVDCNKLHEFDVESRMRTGDMSFLGYVWSGTSFVMFSLLTEWYPLPCCLQRRFLSRSLHVKVAE
jgi:hypothetical protein